MKRELPYFSIEGAFGGSQEWFTHDWWMRKGGCAAVTATDCSLYFSLYKNLPDAAPQAQKKMTKAAYLELGMIMKPYLKPRITGIDKLSIYMEGFTNYLCDRGINDLILTGWSGNHSYVSSAELVKHQIDAGWPLPYLNLKHRAPSFRDLVWHWFLLTGYETFHDEVMVKVTTYGSWRWLSLKELWDTGYKQKGGLILFSRPVIEQEGTGKSLDRL